MFVRRISQPYSPVARWLLARTRRCSTPEDQLPVHQRGASHGRSGSGMAGWADRPRPASTKSSPRRSTTCFDHHRRYPTLLPFRSGGCGATRCCCRRRRRCRRRPAACAGSAGQQRPATSSGRPEALDPGPGPRGAPYHHRASAARRRADAASGWSVGADVRAVARAPRPSPGVLEPRTRRRAARGPGR
jgi:hypothetical protein